MAHCPIEGCDWKGTKSGVPIHLGRVHHIRKSYESLESEHVALASEAKLPAHGTIMDESPSQVCPVPGCGLKVDSLLDHAKLFHKEWFLSDGRFVFEVP